MVRGGGGNRQASRSPLRTDPPQVEEKPILERLALLVSYSFSIIGRFLNKTEVKFRGIVGNWVHLERRGGNKRENYT